VAAARAAVPEEQQSSVKGLPYLHKLPWAAMLHGRPIRTANDGRRYYVDQWGHAIYEWRDRDCDPVELRRWQQAKKRAATRRQQQREGQNDA
jgi:hypothetical protein